MGQLQTEWHVLDKGRKHLLLAAGDATSTASNDSPVVRSPSQSIGFPETEHSGCMTRAGEKGATVAVRGNPLSMRKRPAGYNKACHAKTDFATVLSGRSRGQHSKKHKASNPGDGQDASGGGVIATPGAVVSEPCDTLTMNGGVWTQGPTTATEEANLC